MIKIFSKRWETNNENNSDPMFWWTHKYAKMFVDEMNKWAEYLGQGEYSVKRRTFENNS